MTNLPRPRSLFDVTTSDLFEYATRESSIGIRGFMRISEIGLWTYDTDSMILRYIGYTDDIYFYEAPITVEIVDYLSNIYADDVPGVKEYVEAFSVGGPIKGARYRLIGLSGGFTYIENRIISCKKKVHSPGYFVVGYAQNITDKMNLERELSKAKEKSKEAEKLKTMILANMSHEIRTPLNAIVGFSELLIESNDSEDKAEYSTIIKTNNDILLHIFGDMLDSAKLESGHLELNFTTFDMVEAFNEIFDSMNEKYSYRSEIKFIIDNPYSKCIVTMDRNKFRQIVTNFISNSFKCTPSGSVKMGYLSTDGGIKVYVEDTGIGIAEDKHDRVFRRFEKLDNFTQGAGLGLSICKSIAKALDGKIGFISKPGKGSTFWAWLPTPTEIK